mmetsp:Transcript_9717/g.37938  ORF Transcript_9717/g.37938 Transcript_9717/m.37938 type:complete len:415 (-) Transcript_9717:826-2070(-)
MGLPRCPARQRPEPFQPLQRVPRQRARVRRDMPRDLPRGRAADALRHRRRVGAQVLREHVRQLRRDALPLCAPRPGGARGGALPDQGDRRVRPRPVHQARDPRALRRGAGARRGALRRQQRVPAEQSPRAVQAVHGEHAGALPRADLGADRHAPRRRHRVVRPRSRGRSGAIFQAAERHRARDGHEQAQAPRGRVPVVGRGARGRERGRGRLPPPGRQREGIGRGRLGRRGGHHRAPPFRGRASGQGARARPRAQAGHRETRDAADHLHEVRGPQRPRHGPAPRRLLGLPNHDGEPEAGRAGDARAGGTDDADDEGGCAGELLRAPGGVSGAHCPPDVRHTDAVHLRAVQEESVGVGERELGRLAQRARGGDDNPRDQAARGGAHPTPLAVLRGLPHGRGVHHKPRHAAAKDDE